MINEEGATWIFDEVAVEPLWLARELLSEKVQEVGADRVREIIESFTWERTHLSDVNPEDYFALFVAAYNLFQDIVVRSVPVLYHGDIYNTRLIQ